MTSVHCDILGYSAIAIKLVGEGYIGKSQTAIRSKIDIFIISLFASMILKPVEVEQFYPLGELDSPYFYLLKEISLNDVIINKICAGEEKEAILLKGKINEVTSVCLESYFNVFR